MRKETQPAGPRLSRDAPLRIVAIGGGTGLSTLLKGLKRYSHLQSGAALVRLGAQFPLADITAIVTVTDDGGSSGRLRREFDILPPGDIRNCMAALAEDEALLTRLFQFRFSAGRGLKGHSFGNLFLAALTQITGDFADAVRQSSEVLAITGKIFPSTHANVTLRAELADGSLVDGESRISRSRVPIRRVLLSPARCAPLKETLEAIEAADLITFGPGSLYTSLVPNLLVGGIAAAIERSPAIKACFVNLMWQPGETTGMSAAEHIAAIHRHAGRKLIDYAILNNAPLAATQRRRYARELAQPVDADPAALRRLGVQVAAFDLLASAEKVRHDPAKTAEVAIELAKKGRRRRLRRAPRTSPLE
jgi:uncharacterized cofD-like protein